MIFGWVGLFVMGFAYQSFPRFKYVTLWRPDLANLTLYLMLIGIVSRVAAEMLQPMPVGVGLGILAAGTELAAIMHVHHHHPQDRAAIGGAAQSL